MNIFDFAIKLKKHKELYYRDLSAKASNKGLKNVLAMLADEELRHCRAVEELKARIPAAITETTVLSDAKEEFERMKNSGEQITSDIKQIDLYRKAQELERESWEYYLKKAEETTDHCQRGLFKRIADEDKKHYFLLTNIIDFVSRPESWLENAEFCHLEDY